MRQRVIQPRGLHTEQLLDLLLCSNARTVRTLLLAACFHLGGEFTELLGDLRGVFTDPDLGYPNCLS